MLKFKVGDKVKFTSSDSDLYDEFEKGDIGYVVAVDEEDEEYTYKVGKVQSEDECGGEYDWVIEKHLALVTAGKPVKVVPMKYILQYELDEDPFELFATLPEVKARIRELIKDSSLKRDRIYVYEIKKTTKVEVTTTTSIKGL